MVRSVAADSIACVRVQEGNFYDRNPSKGQLTDAGHILVMAISFRPCLTKSIAKPFVKTLIPTLPVVYISLMTNCIQTT